MISSDVSARYLGADSLVQIVVRPGLGLDILICFDSGIWTWTEKTGLAVARS